EHTARLLAKRGYDVGLFARSTEYLQTIATEIQTEKGGNAIGVEVDLTNQADISDGFEQVRNEFGSIDVYIHNPDYTPERSRDAIDIDLDSFRANWELKAKALYLCTQEVLPVMLERGGTIIVTGSAYGRRAQGKYPAYESAAMAARGFLRSVAKVHAEDAIQCTYVVIDSAVDPEDSDAIHPQYIARQFANLAEQDRSGRINEIEIRGPTDTFKL
ncbi:MAG: SDR family oxidoreductase, partial [Halobacteriaceae archaeon]